MIQNVFSSFGLLATLLAVTNAAILPDRVAEAVRGSPQFQYLGSFSTSTFRLGGSTQSVVSHYFLSPNAASYSTATQDCKELDDTATLAYIETQEELANLTKKLGESGNRGSSYWVGGKYDTSKKTFFWENGVEIGPWAPWDDGHPDTKTTLTKVHIRTVDGLVFRTQFEDALTRYVCELKTGDPEEEADPCFNDNDLIIAVDSSSSVGEVNYMVALEFTTRLAVAWADNPMNRLSVIVYSTGVDSLFNLNQNLSVSEIRDQVNKFKYLGGNTASDLALDRVALEFQQNPRSVPLNLVFLTDGASNSQSLTLAAAQKVQSLGVRSFSVGIGSATGAAELLAIAGNDATRVFNTNGFDDLLKLLQPVSRKVCG